MNELATMNYVSTSELAGILGVDVSTVKKTVKRLENERGNILHHLTNDKYNNSVFMFDERQATLIKQEIASHHNLKSRQIDSVTTELEENQTILKAVSILQQRAETFRIRAEKAEETNALLMHSDKTYTPTEIAKELHLSPKGFKSFLCLEGYLYQQNGDYLPYSQFKDCFTNKQTVINDSFSVYNLHITQLGREKLLKKYGKGEEK